MTSKPVLITGCQRSGTTLTHLILDSHPNIASFEEGELYDIPASEYHGPELDGTPTFTDIAFVAEKAIRYLTNPKQAAYACFQLPMFSANLAFVKQCATMGKVLWLLRDPRDVVVSMLGLRLAMNAEITVSWTAHPWGADFEMPVCTPLLPLAARQALDAYLEQYHIIAQKEPALRTVDEQVLTGALCWRVKQELLAVYEQEDIPFSVIQYEQLVQNPRQAIGKILELFGLPWHEDVLHHHQLHQGTHIGNTDFARPIDSRNVNKWQDKLTEENLRVIKEITFDQAIKFGYYANE